MNRRSFLTSSGARVLEGPAPIRDRAGSGAQQVQSAAGLEEYSGPWGFDQAAHLLRRTLVGVRRENITVALNLGLTAVVDQLLAPTTTPVPPTGYASGTEKPDWTSGPVDTANDGGYQTFLLSWWINLMRTQGMSLREKMTLFWHNHFATGAATVKDARYMYRQNALLRSNAFGNFKNLVRSITFDPAMLRYLNGNANKKGTPNENYARELQELFTIGKGPERAPGDYTNYTEADIKAAARVLTGFSDVAATMATQFTAGNHDSGDKTFTAAYGNRVIKGTKDEAGARSEIDQLLDMIFEQNATARYICRKLYRWFVDYQIDNTVEQNVIGPMATMLKGNNFEIAPVLKALLKSAHFFTDGKIGCVIKTPVDLMVGTAITFDWVGSDLDDKSSPNIVLWSSDTRQRTFRLRTLRRLMAAMGMDLMNPPNVAGWPAYWQSPSYHELWVNADTLQKRINYLNDVASNGFTFDESYGKGLIDVIGFTQSLAQPDDPNALISELAGLLFAVPFTDAQRAQLNDILLPGLPDYEWDAEWSDYLADPQNASKRKGVEDKLRKLYNYMLAMAEYQLS